MSEPVRAVRPVPSTPRSSAPTEVPKLKGGDGDKSGVAKTSGSVNTTMPVPAVADSAPAQVPTADLAHESWHPMDTAPHDGKRVWLADGKGNICESVWRPTRQFRMERNSYGKWVGRWAEGGYWSIMNFGGTKVPFSPRSWHE